MLEDMDSGKISTKPLIGNSESSRIDLERISAWRAGAIVNRCINIEALRELRASYYIKQGTN